MRYGLFGAGAVGRGFLTKVQNLHRELGPVAASSLRVASRIVSSLGAGHAVPDLAALNTVNVILISSAGTSLDRMIYLLMKTPLDWQRKTILFCDTDKSSHEFPQLLKCGASVGSLNSVDGMPDSIFVEGSRDALREARRLARKLGRKPVELQFEQMQVFNAARTISTSLLTPLIDNCVYCLQSSGVDRAVAAQLAEALFTRTLRSYMHAGRRSWSGPIAANDRTAILTQHEAVARLNILRSEYFRQSADCAFDLYRMFPELGPKS